MCNVAACMRFGFVAPVPTISTYVSSCCNQLFLCVVVSVDIAAACCSLRTICILLLIKWRLQLEDQQYLTCRAVHTISSTCSKPCMQQAQDFSDWAGAGALLEKQLVMFCPNIGLLSTCVLSLIPLLRPFSWHSFLMPVLPDKLLGFLEAPVPFIIGVQVGPAPCHDILRVHSAGPHWVMCQSC